MNKIQLTKEQMGQIAAGVLFGGLFVYAYLNYFWLPLAKTIADNTARVAVMEQDINNAKMQKAKYKDLEAKLESLRAEKEEAQKKLPRDRKFPDLLRTVADLSKKYGVNIQAINPTGSAKEEYFVKVYYTLNVSCDYHALGRFMTALGLEERILAMENLNVTGTPGASTSVNATFTLVAYQYSG